MINISPTRDITKMKSRILAACAALTLSLAMLVGGNGSAMAAKNCDPSTWGEQYVVVEQQQGLTIIRVRYAWDGVSVYPDCDGPIVDIRFINGDAVAWRFISTHTVHGTRTVTAQAGETVVRSGGQLNGVKMTRYKDLADWTIAPVG